MRIMGIDPGREWGMSLLDGVPGSMKLSWSGSWGPHESFPKMVRVLRNIPDLLMGQGVSFHPSRIDVLAIEKSWKGRMSFEDLENLCQRTGIMISWVLFANPETRIILVPVGALNTRGKKRGGWKKVKGWKEDCLLAGQSIKGKGDKAVKDYVKFKEQISPKTVHEACSVCIGRWAENQLVLERMTGGR